MAARDRMPARVLLGAPCDLLLLCLSFRLRWFRREHRRPRGQRCRPSTGEGATRNQIAEHATVVRVDAATGDVTAVVPVGPDPLLLAVASGRIWTLNLGDGTLSLVDPSSNEARTVRRGRWSAWPRTLGTCGWPATKRSLPTRRREGAGGGLVRPRIKAAVRAPRRGVPWRGAGVGVAHGPRGR